MTAPDPLTNTVAQYRNRQLVSLFQWRDTKSVYRMVNSLARFSERRIGAVVGFFDPPHVGDRIVWTRSTEREPFIGRIVTRFEVTDGKPRVY